MTEQEHYSLRWNNHQNHILRAFDTLLQTKTLVDVTLVCAETSIRAHKVVLSACSPFFQNVFSETPCKHPVIVLKDFHGWVVQAIVDFMYRGEISVPQERLQVLIQAGESLQVRGLVDHPVSENVPTPAESLDDFMDTSLISPDSPHPSNYDDSPTMVPPPVSNSVKQHHLLRPHMFADGGERDRPAPQHPTHSIDSRENCTSPMPRRKQARPRRRSGECGPHDLTSKPSSPVPSISSNATANSIALAKVEQTLNDENGPDVRHHGPTDLIKNKNTIIPALMRPPIMDDEEEDDEDDDDRHHDLDHDHMNDDAENEHDDPDNEQDEPEPLEDNDSGDGPENLCIKNSINNNSDSISNNNNNNHKNSSSGGSATSAANSNNNNNRIGLSLKDIRHLNRPPLQCRQNPFSPSGSHMDFAAAAAAAAAHHHHQQQQQQKHQQELQSSHPSFLSHPSEDMKREALEQRLENESPYMDQIDLSLAAAAAAAAAHHHHNSGGNMHQRNSRHHDIENSMHKEFTPSSPMSLPSHFNPREGPQHPPSPLQFPGMSSALTLTPPHHMFGLDSPLGLFPPGMDPGKLYNPLMEMPDPRGMHPHHHGPFLKKKSKLSRPKGQHSAPRGGPPRSWTNAELTEALHHVWNKKMTTSQASRLFGIPYNSLLMYVRGKYGKSLNLEQLRKGCISGPPIELLTMGLAAGHNNNSSGGSGKGMNPNRNNKDMKDLDDLHGDAGRASGSGGSMKRSASSEPDLLSNPGAMFNPFPPGFYSDFTAGFPGLPLSMLNLLPPDRHPPTMHNMPIDEDCKSDRSKQSLEDDYPMPQPLALNRDDRRELVQQNGQD